MCIWKSHDVREPSERIKSGQVEREVIQPALDLLNLRVTELINEMNEADGRGNFLKEERLSKLVIAHQRSIEFLKSRAV